MEHHHQWAINQPWGNVDAWIAWQSDVAGGQSVPPEASRGRATSQGDLTLRPGGSVTSHSRSIVGHLAPLCCLEMWLCFKEHCPEICATEVAFVRLEQWLAGRVCASGRIAQTAALLSLSTVLDKAVSGAAAQQLCLRKCSCRLRRKADCVHHACGLGISDGWSRTLSLDTSRQTTVDHRDRAYKQSRCGTCRHQNACPPLRGFGDMTSERRRDLPWSTEGANRLRDCPIRRHASSRPGLDPPVEMGLDVLEKSPPQGCLPSSTFSSATYAAIGSRRVMMRPQSPMRAQFDLDFTKTKRTDASPRPGLRVSRGWPLNEAEESDFPEVLRGALASVLGAFGEHRSLRALEI